MPSSAAMLAVPRSLGCLAFLQASVATSRHRAVVRNTFIEIEEEGSESEDAELERQQSSPARLQCASRMLVGDCATTTPRSVGDDSEMLPPQARKCSDLSSPSVLRLVVRNTFIEVDDSDSELTDAPSPTRSNSSPARLASLSRDLLGDESGSESSEESECEECLWSDTDSSEAEFGEDEPMSPLSPVHRGYGRRYSTASISSSASSSCGYARRYSNLSVSSSASTSLPQERRHSTVSTCSECSSWPLSFAQERRLSISSTCSETGSLTFNAPKERRLSISSLCSETGSLTLNVPKDSQERKMSLSSECSDSHVSQRTRTPSTQCTGSECSLQVQRDPRPSAGSGPHGSGQCKPCAWFWKPQGCRWGDECTYCHLCTSEEIRNRKKSKITHFKLEQKATDVERDSSPAVAETVVSQC